MVSLPRIVVAAPASGQGKTTVATGLLAAFRARGLEVSPHKIGPDYIDPGYHTLAAGRPGRNLDPWLVGEQRIVAMFVRGARTPRPADVAVVEGVMGLFDGAAARGEFASTAHVARLLAAPIVLVVDASGAGRSVGALVHGFAGFDPSVRIGGVVFNRVGSDRHAALLCETVEPMGIPVLGMIHRQDSLAVPSRHLGLVPAAERTAEAAAVVENLGRAVAASIDLDAVLRLARTAAPLPDTPQARADPATPQVRIAMATGSAFTFGYAEHPELLRAAGAEVVMFDPLTDEDLPPDVDGLVIGGGFPEAHAVNLSANVAMRSRVAELARSGAPVIAECAGLLYLGRSLDGHKMCGILDADAVMTERLTLGYREAVAPVDSAFAPAGTRVSGHEFHRTTVTAGTGVQPAWQWRTHRETVSEGIIHSGVHASYLHLHWAGIPGAAERIVAACRHRGIAP